jgi:hypothetical protein
MAEAEFSVRHEIVPIAYSRVARTQTHGLLNIRFRLLELMPNDNPLKRIMVALSYRVGATAAAGMLVIPATPIPGLDAVIDIGAPVALIWYWWIFFRDARRRPPEKPAP